MPISLAVMACGFGLFYFGTRGFTAKGIQFSPKTRLVGSTGKLVGTICIVAGVALAIVGAYFIMLITKRQAAH